MDKSIASLGEVMQLAFVPGDFTAALRYWTGTMGVGPFFEMPHIAYREARYRGAPSKIDFSVAIAYWGDIQIELIQQHDQSPSIYKSWRDAGREGLHHTCIVVDDIKRSREVCLAAGATVEQEIVLDGAEAFYVDTGGGPGTLLEVIHFAPALAGVFTMMRDAARGWDGKDPLRSLG